MAEHTILCISSYEKGQAFIRQCKQQGWHVLMLTNAKLEHANWPRECIDEFFIMPDLTDRQQMVNGVSYLARKHQIDRIVALDEFDIEMAASLREHLRVPGMGETTSRHFRDKLAMRKLAHEHGVRVPEFEGVINHERLRKYTERVPAPWVLKPRTSASAIGIKKIHQADELWPLLEALGDEQSHHVLERFVPGDVYHVDSIVSEKEVVFAAVSKYGDTPMNVAHGGGVFTTRLIPRDSLEIEALESINREVIHALKMVRGVTHAEFIRAQTDGHFYFLEIAARVGGANIAEMIEAGTGVNLWAEWAKIETATKKKPYVLQAPRMDYSGILISLAKQQWPDLSAYTEAEIVWRMKKEYHAGLIVVAPQHERVKDLLDSYTERFYQDFYATAPLPDKPTA